MDRQQNLRAVWLDECPYVMEYARLSGRAEEALRQYLAARRPRSLGGTWEGGGCRTRGELGRPIDRSWFVFKDALDLASRWIDIRYNPDMWIRTYDEAGLYRWTTGVGTQETVIELDNQGIDCRQCRTPRQMIEAVRKAGRLVPTPGGVDE